MDTIIDKALENGAIVPKVCGAGGGGCIAFFCEDGRRTKVEAALNEIEGAEVLDWKPSIAGLQLKIT